MAKVVGPSGIVIDTEETIAAGLVRSGHARYADGDIEPEHVTPEPQKPAAKPKRSSKRGGGSGTSSTGDGGGSGDSRDRHQRD